MARFVDAIDLPIPAQEAFDYLADFSNTAEWDPGVVATERLDEDPIGLGSRFRVTVAFALQTLTLDYQITCFEPPTRLVLRGRDDASESIDELTFTPREGGTRVTYEARVELRGLRRLADPLVDLVFQRVGSLAARGLRERVAERVRDRAREGRSAHSDVNPNRGPARRATSARRVQAAPRATGERA